MDSLTDIDRKHIWHPFTPLDGSPSPIFIESGSGVYLHTRDGRRIIDGISSWWVNLHGHARPEIARAIAQQAHTLEHVIFAGFTHAPAIELVKNLLQILPGNQARLFFSDNGSTAVEVALKMAIQHGYNNGVSRRKIIAIDGAYHGDTFGSMSAGSRGLFTEPFSPYLFDVEFIEFPHDGREEAAFRQFREIVMSGDAGIFIFEPLVQAAGGMRMYDAGWLDRVIGLAKSQGLICIADEVFTGFGRTGKFFASDYLENKPDIIAISKGITGGALPLGVTSCSEEIASAFATEDIARTFFHGHSYTANPLACAAANASFGILTSAECRSSIDRIAQRHEAFVKRLRDNPRIAAIKSLGTILSIELITDDDRAYANPIRKRIYEYFLRRDILLRPLGNVIYVLPPYVITDEELDVIYGAIEDFLGEL